MANGISPVFGPQERVLSTPQFLSRYCEFRLPAEPQKQYCSSHVNPMFPVPGHLPTLVSSLKKARISSRWSSQFSIPDRKSTRLNSSHQINSYPVFCWKKKKLDSPHSTSHSPF